MMRLPTLDFDALPAQRKVDKPGPLYALKRHATDRCALDHASDALREPWPERPIVREPATGLSAPKVHKQPSARLEGVDR